MSIFLFILFVFSGLEFLGYPLVDVFLLGVFLFLLTVSNHRRIKVKINWVLLFFIYMILQVVRGMFVLADYRMVYWAFFFIVVYLSYLYLLDLNRKRKTDEEFVKKIFNYSLAYFIIYGLLGATVSDPDDYQGIWWIGSSAAFLVIIPFVCSHYQLFRNSGYSIYGLRLPSILLVLAVTVIHYSRSGMYMLFLYIAYLVLKTSIVNPRKIALMILFVVVTFAAWDFSRNIFYTDQTSTGTQEIAILQSTLGENELTADSFENDLGRFLMVLSIYDKFVSSPVEILFGSGWYTSRQTLKPFEKKIRNEFGLNTDILDGNKPLQVITLAAIISDTGIIGLFFILYFFFKSAQQISQTGNQGRVIFLIMLFSNWLFYFVGYTYTSVLAFLLFLPNGILVSIAKSEKLPKNQNK